MGNCLKSFIAAFALFLFASSANAQQVCNSQSGFMKLKGPIVVGDLVSLGADCQSMFDAGTNTGLPNVIMFGADPTGIVSSTAAFQNIITASCNSGSGKFYIPPGRYLVGAINMTNCNNVIMTGAGDQTQIVVNGSDVQGNWWDLSGSNNIHAEFFRVVDNGSQVRIVWLWACTGTSCGTSGVLSGLSFDHVNMSVKTVLAGLYAYGYGCAANCANNISGGSLNISNASWKITANGPVGIEETRNAVLDLTAYNVGSIRSAYVTLTTSTAIAARTHLFNVDLIDLSNGTSLSNNAAMVLDGTNQFVSVGGSYQCLCVADVIMWTSTEGIVMDMPAFQASIASGDGCVVNYWIEMGGGFNGSMTFNTPFWSCPAAGGAYIALDKAVSAGNGGMGLITLNGNDPGLNTHLAPFVGKTAAGCGPFTVGFNWISNTNLQLLTNANDIVTCGSIDAHTVFWNVNTVTIPGGAADLSHHF